MKIPKGVTREMAEAIVNNHQHCLIHDCPMVKVGEYPDLCGTWETECPKCKNNGGRK